MQKKAGERPSLFSLGLQVAEAVDAQPALVAPPGGRTALPWGHVTQLYGSCGSGVRPFIWIDPTPHLGTPWAVHYSLFPLPRESGIYDLQGAWVVVSLVRPRNEEEPVHVFPNDCGLLWDLTNPLVLMWSFAGVQPFHDFLMTRQANGREVRLDLSIGAIPEIAGQKAWTQAILWTAGEFKFTQLYEVTFGVPVSAFSTRSK